MGISQDKEIQDSIKAHSNSIITRMYVDTADQNYIAARWCYFNKLHIDAFWLSLHCIEKYLKAIHLFNGRSVKEYRHDILKLFNDLNQAHQDIAIKDFSCPCFFPEEFWLQENPEKILNVLNSMGPEIRYGFSSFSVTPDFIHKIDHLVWEFRKYCRPLEEVLDDKAAGKPKVINWCNFLKHDDYPDKMHIGGYLEKILKSDTENEARKFFLKYNAKFSPEALSQISKMSFESSASPMYALISYAENDKYGKHSKRVAAGVFDWLLKNNFLSREDKKYFEEKKSEALCKINKTE